MWVGFNVTKKKFAPWILLNFYYSSHSQRVIKFIYNFFFLHHKMPLHFMNIWWIYILKPCEQHSGEFYEKKNLSNGSCSSSCWSLFSFSMKHRTSSDWKLKCIYFHFNELLLNSPISPISHKKKIHAFDDDKSGVLRK